MRAEVQFSDETETKPFVELLTFKLEGTPEIPLEDIRITWMGQLNNYGWTKDTSIDAAGEPKENWREMTPAELSAWHYELVDGVFVPPSAAADAVVGSRYKLLVQVPPLELANLDMQRKRWDLPLTDIYGEIRNKYGASAWDEEQLSPFYRDPLNTAFRSFLANRGLDVAANTIDLTMELEGFTLRDFYDYVGLPLQTIEQRKLAYDNDFCLERCIAAAYETYPSVESRKQKINAILRPAGITVNTDTPLTIKDGDTVKDASKYWCIFENHEIVEQRHYGSHNVRSS